MERVGLVGFVGFIGFIAYGLCRLCSRALARGGRRPRTPRRVPVHGPSRLAPELATVRVTLPRVAPSGAGLAGW